MDQQPEDQLQKEDQPQEERDQELYSPATLYEIWQNGGVEGLARMLEEQRRRRGGQ